MTEGDGAPASDKVARILPTLFVLGVSLPNLLLAFVAPSILRDMMLPPAKPLPLIAQGIGHSPVLLLGIAFALPVLAIVIALLVKDSRRVAILNSALTILCVIQSVVTFVALFLAFLAHLSSESKSVKARASRAWPVAAVIRPEDPPPSQSPVA